MSIIRCDNGHYYDNTKFAQCPHCGVLPVMNGNAEPKQEKKPKRFSFFKRKEKTALGIVTYEEDDDRTVALEEDDDRTIAYEEDDDRTIALEEDDDRTVAYEEDDDRTVALEEDNDRTIALEEEDDDRTIALEREDDSTVGLEEGNQTVFQQELDPEITIPSWIEESQETSRDYIVGWIVCGTGMDKGRDYRLYQGFNRIVLRQNRVRVVLQAKDQDEVAGAIVYDDNSNSFFIMPQQDEICLNGTSVVEAKEIHSGDEITAAGETFIFVAFCGEGRRWDAENK